MGSMAESAETISVTVFLLMPWYGLFFNVKATIFLLTNIHTYPILAAESIKWTLTIKKG